MDKEKMKGLFRKEWTFSQSNKIKQIIGSFSIAEKVIFYGLVSLFTLSALSLLWQVNENYLVAVPAHGGTLTEGVIGSPRFVNPILALSDADRDLTQLVYSGLLKEDASGNLIPDLAQSYGVSADGLTYTFVLKSGLVFQDGTPITADDVLFTVEKAQDPTLKSPKLSAWNGVITQKVDDHTITFTLRQPYSAFPYTATLGILPKHIWKNVNDDSFPFSSFNVKPVGSGPYQVKTVRTDGSGLPTEYDLTSNSKYTLGEAYISSIVMKFYQNEDESLAAYNNGDVNSINSITPQNVASIKRSDGAIMKANLSRVFGVFFNQNSAPVLVNKEVRSALDVAIDKQAIIDNVLSGYGTAIDGPLPTDVDTGSSATSSDAHIVQAKAILEKAGWTLGSDGIYVKIDKKTKKTTATLAFSISTSDTPELKATAEMLQATWTLIGAKVDVKIFEIGDLNQNIIRPRKYDALLFGEIVSPGLDLYPFWHSSQRNDPGLNISMYANIKADAILENMRKTTDMNARLALEQQFESQVSADKPAIFLYSPSFIYIVPKDIQNIQFPTLTTASDRFVDINQWYITTNKIWKIFTKQ